MKAAGCALRLRVEPLGVWLCKEQPKKRRCGRRRGRARGAWEQTLSRRVLEAHAHKSCVSEQEQSSAWKWRLRPQTSGRTARRLVVQKAAGKRWCGRRRGHAKAWERALSRCLLVTRAHTSEWVSRSSLPRGRDRLRPLSHQVEWLSAWRCEVGCEKVGGGAARSKEQCL